MSWNVDKDQLALIRIDGLFSHKCDDAIRRALTKLPGVHEVEVDFNSGQASILYDGAAIAVKQLVDAITGAGYKVTGYAQRDFGSNDTAAAR